jgi:hypothetical protein
MTEQNSLYDRVFNTLVERRERILSGKINCIPWGLPRFEEELPGIEQGKYYNVTANSKVGNVLPS